MNFISEFQASSAVAKQFEEKGYLVTLEPSSAMIPFDLENYRPDILAVKPGGESVLVEVKQSNRNVDRERYLRVAQLVDQHPGWTFKLVTVPGQLSMSSPARDSDTRKISKELEAVDVLLNTAGMESFAIIPLWNVYMAVLQHLLDRQYDQEVVAQRTDLGLVSLAYSLGVLSYEEFETAKSMLHLRNKVAHEMGVVVSSKQFGHFRDHLDRLLKSD